MSANNKYGLAEKGAVEPVVGKIYKVRHTRKGEFVVKVTRIVGNSTKDDAWVEAEIVSGDIAVLNPANYKGEGEQVNLRRSFCTFFEVAAA